MIKRFFVINFIFFLFLGSVYADDVTSKITKIGCHINTSMCYVYLEESITSDICSSTNSLRWGSDAGFNMAALYSTLLAAHATGKKVTFGGAGEVCYRNYASFVFATINDF
jgi:hypothetical protein